MDELKENLKEIVQKLLEDGEPELEAEFVGTQAIQVATAGAGFRFSNRGKVCSILLSRGFVEVRQRGSHRQFRHTDGRGTTVPDHQGRDVSPVLLRQIAKDIGRTIE